MARLQAASNVALKAASNTEKKLDQILSLVQSAVLDKGIIIEGSYSSPSTAPKRKNREGEEHEDYLQNKKMIVPGESGVKSIPNSTISTHEHNTRNSPGKSTTASNTQISTPIFVDLMKESQRLKIYNYEGNEIPIETAYTAYKSQKYQILEV